MDRVFATFSVDGETEKVDFQVEEGSFVLPEASQLKALTEGEDVRVEGSLEDQLKEINGIGDTKAEAIMEILEG